MIAAVRSVLGFFRCRHTLHVGYPGPMRARNIPAVQPEQSGEAPPRSPCPPIVVLPDDEYEAWVAENPDEAA